MYCAHPTRIGMTALLDSTLCFNLGHLSVEGTQGRPLVAGCSLWARSTLGCSASHYPESPCAELLSCTCLRFCVSTRHEDLCVFTPLHHTLVSSSWDTLCRTVPTCGARQQCVSQCQLLWRLWSFSYSGRRRLMEAETDVVVLTSTVQPPWRRSDLRSSASRLKKKTSDFFLISILSNMNFLLPLSAVDIGGLIISGFLKESPSCSSASSAVQFAIKRWRVHLWEKRMICLCLCVCFRQGRRPAVITKARSCTSPTSPTTPASPACVW